MICLFYDIIDLVYVIYYYINFERFKHILFFRDSHIDTITKVGFLTTNTLMDFMKCNRSYVFTDTWGYFINNTWNGIMGKLLYNESDLGGWHILVSSNYF